MSRIVLVTGAGSGLGEAEARLFHAQGDTVVLADVNLAAVEAVAAELGERAIPVHLDVSDPDSWAAAVAIVTERAGTIGVLVNNAGVFDRAGIADGDLAKWEWQFNVNVWGTLHGIRAVVPGMRELGGGAIVNTISVAGLRGLMAAPSYSTSKWAVRGLTRNAALELSKDNIRVNGVVPGVINTPASSAAGYPTTLPAQAVPQIGEPHELARVTVFLAADESRYITGAEYVCDGGSLAGTVTG